MKLAFVKMHGIGNDFVLIDNMSRALDLEPDQIRLLADRHRGVGCDQLLIVEPPSGPTADVRARIFNQDGSESGQCGNGLRCAAVWLREIGVANGECVVFEAGDGLVRANLGRPDAVEIDIGVPRFEPADIPFLADRSAPAYRLQIGPERFEVGVVSMGNPHAVLCVDDIESARVRELGPAVQDLEVFPQGVNVGFMQIIDEARVRLRVYERGVGETLACGSGAGAAVVVGNVRGWLGPRVTVTLPGGELVVNWRGEGEPVWLTGPTRRAFEGEFEL